MRFAAIAGALLLMAAGPSFAGSHIGRMASVRAESPSAARLLTDAQIAQFKADLRLRPDQELPWVAVARVLRSMVRQPGPGAAGYSYVGGVNQPTVASVTSMLDVQRLAAAARPLVAVLDYDQKMAALNLVQAMGFGSVMEYF